MKYTLIDVDGTNCYAVFSDRESRVMLIDPAFEQDRILEACRGFDIDKILLTHGHMDHFYDCCLFSAPVYISEKDKIYIENRALSAPYDIFPYLEKRKYDIADTFSDGDRIAFCEYSFEVLEVPGHTPGQCAFYAGGVLFCGDLIFKNSVGRTDFPGGNEADMANSLSRIMTLPEDTVLCPGHGPLTNVREEKYHNEFVEYYIRRYKNENK